jgi:hypothetical protein
MALPKLLPMYPFSLRLPIMQLNGCLGYLGEYLPGRNEDIA